MAAGRGGDGSAAFGGTDPAAGGKCAQDRVLFRRPHFDAGTACGPCWGRIFPLWSWILAPYREAIEERQAELEAESDQELEQLIAERTGSIYFGRSGQAGHADSGAGGDRARRRRYAGSR